MNRLRESNWQDTTTDEALNSEVGTFIENETRVFNDGLGPRWKFWRRKRYTLVAVVSLGEFTKTLLRSNLSVAVFPMTENYTTINANGTKEYVQDFDWDAKTRGFLLSVYFYGYIATNILGGIMALKFGGGRLYGVGILLTSITTLFTPVAAHIHVYALIAIRIFEGMCEGVLNPSLELLIAKWIPIDERSSCVALTVTGSVWGHVVSTAASGAIGFYLGWKAIFYCTGGFGVAWFVIWLTVVKENPKKDKSVSVSELAYIQASCGRNTLQKCKVSTTPYIKIITSMAVWSCLLANAACTWNYVIFITHTPAYIKDVLKLDYVNSGYLASLPFIINVLATCFISPITDLLTAKRVLTFTVARKVYISGSLTMMAIMGLLIQQATTTALVVSCMSISVTFSTLAHVQILVNILDLAPRYSSVLTGMAITIFSLNGMLVPTFTGYLTQNKTVGEWNTVFSIQSGICLLGALQYIVFASGKLQPWADGRKRNPQ